MTEEQKQAERERARERRHRRSQKALQRKLLPDEYISEVHRGQAIEREVIQISNRIVTEEQREIKLLRSRDLRASQKVQKWKLELICGATRSSQASS